MHKIDFRYNATYIVRHRDFRPQDGLCTIKGRQQIITVLDPSTVARDQLYATHQTGAPQSVEESAEAEFLYVRNTDGEVHLLHPLTIEHTQLINLGPEPR